MNKRLFLLIFPLVLVLFWYFGFYSPLSREIQQTRERNAALEAQLSQAAEDLSRLNRMESALAETDYPEIAPYDNSAGALTLLNQALAGCGDYSLTFSDPVFSGDGLVRRNILLRLSCGRLAELTGILDSLENAPIRCRITALSLTATNLYTTPITANATITFYERQ